MMGPGKRTFAGIVIEYFFAFGQLILVFIAYFVRDWRTLSWIVIILTLPFLSYFLYVPFQTESMPFTFYYFKI